MNKVAFLMVATLVSVQHVSANNSGADLSFVEDFHGAAAIAAPLFDPAKELQSSYRRGQALSDSYVERIASLKPVTSRADLNYSDESDDATRGKASPAKTALSAQDTEKGSFFTRFVRTVAAAAKAVFSWFGW